MGLRDHIFGPFWAPKGAEIGQNSGDFLINVLSVTMKLYWQVYIGGAFSCMQTWAPGVIFLDRFSLEKGQNRSKFRFFAIL